MSCNLRTWQAGFTLTELLVVLAIMGAMSIAAFSVISGGLTGKRAKTFAYGLVDDLRMIRSDAIVSGTATSATLDLAERRYSLFSDRQPRQLPDGLALRFCCFRPGQRVTQTPQVAFFPDGSSTGGAIMILSDSEILYQVSIDWLTGRIAVDD